MLLEREGAGGVNGRSPIGFVVPAYNAERTVAETLRSLQAQTMPDWSAVVVDDGSSDGTASAVAALADPRITLVRQQNAGVARARNLGLRSLHADAVAFVDADDTVAPTFAERALRDLSDDAGAVACWHAIVGPRLQPLDWVVPVHREELGLAELCRYNPLAIGAVVMRREAFKDVAVLGDRSDDDPEFPFRTEDGILADWGHWLRVARAGIRWAPVIPEPLYHYRLIDGSLSRDTRKMCDDGKTLIARYAPPDLLPSCTRAWLVRCLARAIAHGDRAAVQEYRTQLGPWQPPDRDTLLGTLRWAFQFANQSGPSFDECRGVEWASTVAQAIPDLPWPEEIPRCFRATRDRWLQAAERARGMMHVNDRLVVYGLGRNGRECAALLNELRIPFQAVDDCHSTIADFSHDGPEIIDAACVVLVTPDNHSSITRSLRERGITRIVQA